MQIFCKKRRRKIDEKMIKNRSLRFFTTCVKGKFPDAEFYSLQKDRSNLFDYNSGSISNFIVKSFLTGLKLDCNSFCRAKPFI